MPLVSVVVPAYNAERFLAQAVASVMAQTYDDWELIITDDGSTDSTSTIAAKLAPSRTLVLRQQNRGPGSARNAGINAAKGDFVAFLDADDEWDSAFLATTIPWLERNPEVAACYTDFRYIDAEGNSLPQSGLLQVTPRRLFDTLLEGGFFPPCCVAARRKVLCELSGFDQNLTALEDWDMWLRIAEAHRMIHLPGVLARYRVTPGSMSSDPLTMHTGRLRTISKRFGTPDGNSMDWPAGKRRAFAFAYRSGAFDYASEGAIDDALQLLVRVGEILPEVLGQASTFFELGCAHQPRGQRGVIMAADLPRIEAEIATYLNGLTRALPRRRRSLESAAYQALATSFDQVGSRSIAQNNLRNAALRTPSLLADPRVVVRLLGLSGALRRLYRMALAPAITAAGRDVNVAGDHGECVS